MTTTAQRLESVQEYYFSRKLREVAALVKAGHPVINMGIGSPELAPPPEVVNTLTKSLAHPRAHMYQSYQGLPELREAMASFYQKNYGVALDPQSEVLPLMGSKEGIMHISMAFLNRGDKALIPNPGYPTYASVTQLVEAEPVYYDLKEETHWQPDLDALEALDTTRVKLCWLNYPHMPTGTLADKNTLQRLIDWATTRQILLVHDNPYSFILNQNPQSLLALPGAKAVALELNSLSKSFNMAGWRVGMVSGHAESIKAILKVKSNMDSGMFFGLQQGAISALQQSSDWFASINKVYAKRRIIMEQLIQYLGLEYTSSQVGMFLWAKIPDAKIKATDFTEQLLQEHHIFIAPGTIFGSQGEGYVRFSLCVNEDQIQTALNRIKK